MISKCDLIFYRGNGLISKSIRFLSNSKYSHIGLILDKFHVLEIDWKYKSKIRHISYKKENYDVYEYVGLTNLQKYKIINYTYNIIGRKYSHYENFRTLLYLWLRIKLSDDTQHQNCVELTVDAYKNGANIDLINNKDIVIFEDILKNPRIQLKVIK